MDVMPLGDHLGADQQIEFSGVKLVQNALEVMTGAHSVAIETPDAGTWKSFLQSFLNLFGSGAEKIQMLAAALRAKARN